MSPGSFSPARSSREKRPAASSSRTAATTPFRSPARSPSGSPPFMPDASERELLRALAGMEVSPERIRQLLGDRDARRRHVARRVLAAHPKTPRAHALALVPTLYWRDLAWISSEARAHPAIRRAADLEILRRFPGL